MAATPRFYEEASAPSVLPLRPAHSHLPEVNGMELGDFAVAPVQFLMQRGAIGENEVVDLQSSTAFDFPVHPGIFQGDRGGLGDNNASAASMMHTDSQRSYLTGHSGPAESPPDDAYTHVAGTEILTSESDEDILGMGSRYMANTTITATASTTSTTTANAGNNSSSGSYSQNHIDMGYGRQPALAVPNYVNSVGDATDMMRVSSTNTYYSVAASTSSSFDAASLLVPNDSSPSGYGYGYGQHHHHHHNSLDTSGMERSVSASSARSNHSLQLRAKNSLRQQNSNANKTQIRPKMEPVAGTDASSAAGPSRLSTSMSGFSQASGVEGVVVGGGGGGGGGGSSSTSDGKMKISKAKRERPKSKKLYCDECESRPEGFRGEHELQRHKSSRHSAEVKRWICRDPRLEGIETSVTVVRPLADCKNCRERKTYNAYYNAAAHLRRTHFKEKPARKAPGSSKASGGDRKGAKATADDDSTKDWPEMTELKKWMCEITLYGDQAQSAVETTEQTEAEEYGDEDDFDFALLDDAAACASSSTCLGSSDNSQNSQNSQDSQNSQNSDDMFAGMGLGFGDALISAGVSIAHGGVDVGVGVGVGVGVAEYGNGNGNGAMAAPAAEFQAEMPMLASFPQLYDQNSLISSAQFFGSQLSSGQMPFNHSGLMTSTFVNNPSGTTTLIHGTTQQFQSSYNFGNDFDLEFQTQGH